MMRRELQIVLLMIGWGQALDCPPALDKSLTLFDLHPYEFEWHRGKMATGSIPLGFTDPQPQNRECREEITFPNRPLLTWDDSTSVISFLPILGQEMRLDSETVSASEAGVILSGGKGLVSFSLDTRTYMEVGGNSDRPSFDHQIVDSQDGDVTGALDYRSYSRFQGDLNLTLPFGNLSVARNSAHWGPGLFENLTFSEEAIPFYQYLFTSDIGPLHVASLYGDLLIGENQSYSSENREQRSLYAHRYELTLGTDWLMGVTEQLVLYEMGKPYLFAPIFPLFIAKGFLYEGNTNGNLAVDLTWRSPWSTLLYGEFLLDDLESPSSLFLHDYIQNKWGVMAGFHWAHLGEKWSTGIIGEFSYIRPWVYAHFQPRTAQFSNLGQPLGNPSGPDSRNGTIKVYGRKGESWYAGCKFGVRWKGKGPGSDEEQPVPETPLESQESLLGAKAEFFGEPEVVWKSRVATLFLSARLSESSSARLGVRVFR